MDRDVQAGPRLQVVECRRELAHRLVDAGESHAQGRYDADGVLVAVARELSGLHAEGTAGQRYLPELHVEVAGKLVPRRPDGGLR